MHMVSVRTFVKVARKSCRRGRAEVGILLQTVLHKVSSANVVRFLVCEASSLSFSLVFILLTRFLLEEFRLDKYYTICQHNM
jgi:hypothetical protein